jgi:ABC-2 type transport system ATP-binding protein
VVFSSHQLDLVEHLCEKVVIIDHGRQVVSGDVDSLTTGSERRLLVSVAGRPDGAWASRLPGVTLSERGRGRVRLVLAPGVDPQAVLRAASQVGPVEHFSFERRRLSEVFREALAR